MYIYYVELEDYLWRIESSGPIEGLTPDPIETALHTPGPWGLEYGDFDRGVVVNEVLPVFLRPQAD